MPNNYLQQKSAQRLSIPTLVSESHRMASASDPDLGAGNFLNTALKHSPAPQENILYFENALYTPFGKFAAFSLAQLDDLSAYMASHYKSLNVKAGDPVAIYLEDGPEYLLHYLALCKIGAISVLINSKLDVNIALAHAKRVGSVGIVTDKIYATVLDKTDATDHFSFITTFDGFNPTAEPLSKEQEYFHSPGDTVIIAHSSGTTGIPKAVPLDHDKYFYGIRYRLGMPRIGDGERILSSLPQSHNCAIAYLMLALLGGTPFFMSSSQNGKKALQLIEKFQPTMVVAFPQTFVEMTEEDLDLYDLDSVALWFNGGDAAHENHIRRLISQGSHHENGELVPGSYFIDGMGSSEMGFSLFRHVHTPTSNKYQRCVGKPLDWVDATIINKNDQIAGVGEVGRLAVKAPSVTTGYWNDGVLTAKSRVRGYFLTGDLAYRDRDGYFYHVDRISRF